MAKLRELGRDGLLQALPFYKQIGLSKCVGTDLKLSAYQLL
jgi:hypothetical protein